jgi:hypothetical protein
MAWIQGRPDKPGFYFYRDELRELTVMGVRDISIGNEPQILDFEIIGRDDMDDYPEGEHWSEPITLPPK